MKIEWELIGKNTYRAKVIGGWVLNHFGEVYESAAESMVFIPDPGHIWGSPDEFSCRHKRVMLNKCWDCQEEFEGFSQEHLDAYEKSIGIVR